ncbi:MAG: NAD-dependent epimerase/dehydratase family protein [Alphaproteobacteria bacterium]|nr:NAD-dependent epimerase/dehydratase family protein [Alphaproteobacteria bacterium]
MTILATGAARFIGAAVSRALLARGEQVVGVDNLNDYNEVSLKQSRLDTLTCNSRADISDRDAILRLADEFGGITDLIHLAAQAGVRYSLVNPYAYVTANVMGQVVMLEMAQQLPKLQHFV